MIWLVVAQVHAAEHVVRRSDSLQSIARAWGTDVPTLQRMNGLRGAELPPPGSVLLVPDRPGSTSVPAVLASVVGEVRATDPKGAPVAVRIGSALPMGSTVCTEVESWATIRLAAVEGAGHDDVFLAQNTCVKVRLSTASLTNRQSRLDLETGSLAVRTNDQPGEVSVNTPAGLATGGSGGFRVHLEADHKTRVEAIGADAALIGAGKEVGLERGFGSRVAPGRAPEAPTKLPDPGDPSYPDDGSVLLDPVFAWTPVDRALGYRLEVATAPDFSETVWVEDVPGTAYTPEVLFLPFRVRGLWWRVASFDRTGFLGIPSDPRSLTFPAGLGP